MGLKSVFGSARGLERKVFQQKNTNEALNFLQLRSNLHQKKEKVIKIKAN